MTQFTTDRRSVVKGAAWAVPAISVAAAAPTLAASPGGADLSTSVPNADGSTRSGTQLTIAPTTFINSGDANVEGLTVLFESTEVIESFALEFLDYELFGIVVTGEGTNALTAVIQPGTALGQVTIPPGDDYASPVGQILTFANTSALTLTVTVTPTNGGVPFVTSQEIPAG